MFLFTSLIADHCTSLFSLSVCLLVPVNPSMHAAIATEDLELESPPPKTVHSLTKQVAHNGQNRLQD